MAQVERIANKQRRTRKRLENNFSSLNNFRDEIKEKSERYIGNAIETIAVCATYSVYWPPP